MRPELFGSVLGSDLNCASSIVVFSPQDVEVAETWWCHHLEHLVALLGSDCWDGSAEGSWLWRKGRRKGIQKEWLSGRK